jgi:hypothetical protein
MLVFFSFGCVDFLFFFLLWPIAIETFFFQLVREALARRVITQDEVQKEITAGHIRTDLLVMLRQNA